MPRPFPPRKEDREAVEETLTAKTSIIKYGPYQANDLLRKSENLRRGFSTKNNSLGISPSADGDDGRFPSTLQAF